MVTKYYYITPQQKNVTFFKLVSPLIVSDEIAEESQKPPLPYLYRGNDSYSFKTISDNFFRGLDPLKNCPFLLLAHRARLNCSILHNLNLWHRRL